MTAPVASGGNPPGYLVDTYLDWARGEGLPIHEGDAVNPFDCALAPWPRMGPGCRGGFVHLAGRGDFVALQIVEIAPGASIALPRRQFNEIWFALAGDCQVSRGPAAAIYALSRRGLFAPAVGEPHAIQNTSPNKPARLLVASNLPFLMNFFRSEQFLFNSYFVGSGGRDQILPTPPRFIHADRVADMDALDLPVWSARGEGVRQIEIGMGEGVLRAQVVELASGCYAKARRHGEGTHVIALGGRGYSLVFAEGDSSFERHDWEHGLALAPSDDRFTQHFNPDSRPARYLILSLGGAARPILARKAERRATAELAVGGGGTLIDYSAQAPAVHPMFEMECARNGITLRMSAFGAKGAST